MKRPTSLDAATRSVRRAGARVRRLVRRARRALPSASGDDRATEVVSDEDTEARPRRKQSADRIDEMISAAERACAEGAANAHEMVGRARAAVAEAAQQAKDEATDAIERARDLAERALQASDRLERVESLAADDQSGDGDDPPDALDRDDESLTARSKEQLYEMAKRADIDGRSTMTKDELVDALSGHR